MQLQEYLEGFDECPTCGAVVLEGEDCPVCEEEERKHTPKRPQGLVKIDPKRYKKTHRRKTHDRY